MLFVRLVDCELHLDYEYSSPWLVTLLFSTISYLLPYWQIRIISWYHLEYILENKYFTLIKFSLSNYPCICSSTLIHPPLKNSCVLWIYRKETILEINYCTLIKFCLWNYPYIFSSTLIHNFMVLWIYRKETIAVYCASRR